MVSRSGLRTKVLGIGIGLALAGVVNLSVAAVEAASLSRDEDAIRARVGELATLFNNKAAKAVSAFWLADGSLVNPAGLSGKGPAEIEKVIVSDFATVLNDTTTSMRVVAFRPVGKDAAWVELEQAVSGLKGAEGKPLPTMTFHVPCLMVKRGKTWMIAEARPYAYLR